MAIAIIPAMPGIAPKRRPVKMPAIIPVMGPIEKIESKPENISLIILIA